jgi:hypothetical protein
MENPRVNIRPFSGPRLIHARDIFEVSKQPLFNRPITGQFVLPNHGSVYFGQSWHSTKPPKKAGTYRAETVRDLTELLIEDGFDSAFGLQLSYIVESSEE